jgi:Intracellular proteinase inhibitor
MIKSHFALRMGAPWAALVMVAVISPIASNGQVEPTLPAKPVPPPGISIPVAVSVAADKKTYTTKDPIKLTLTAKNTGKKEVRLTFNNSMKYDFEIRKGKGTTGEKIWQWSHMRLFAQMVSFTSLDPGKTLTFSETYTPGEKGPDGQPLPSLAPGTYTASAILAIGGRAPRPSAWNFALPAAEAYWRGFCCHVRPLSHVSI